MKILTIETSGKLCGVCISDNEQIIDKIELNNGLTHSESLMPIIKEILHNNNLQINNFDGFVCDIGPGSFTGIRIGVATAKAFVDTLPNAKFTGVSSLEALAYNVDNTGLICSLIDCKNNNCYYALYELKNNTYLELLPPTASSISELIDILKPYNCNISFIGDGALIYKNELQTNISSAKFLEESFNTINTSNLALAGVKKIQYNKELPLTPMYLKKPQAQRLLEEKQKNSGKD